jgi:hypothetical protein
LSAETDAKGRTWEQFVAQWIVNEAKWLKEQEPDPELFGVIMRAQFYGIIDRDMAKAYLRKGAVTMVK